MLTGVTHDDYDLFGTGLEGDELEHDGVVVQTAVKFVNRGEIDGTDGDVNWEVFGGTVLEEKDESKRCDRMKLDDIRLLINVYALWGSC